MSSCECPAFTLYLPVVRDNIRCQRGPLIRSRPTWRADKTPYSSIPPPNNTHEPLGHRSGLRQDTWGCIPLFSPERLEGGSYHQLELGFAQLADPLRVGSIIFIADSLSSILS